MKAASGRATYGFDAPGVIRGLLVAGIVGVVVGASAEGLASGWIRIATLTVGTVAIVPLLLGISMVAYGVIGKHRMRDHMLSLIDWHGDERVLDIGTGRGLLLIGAAKRLDRGGTATGIDIWLAEDLTDNTLDRLAENVGAEGVDGRVALMTEDARTLSFPDASFDVVLSLYCIHNIEDKAEQKSALLEIVRVLRPGGRALIGEYLPTHRYADIFREAGMKVHASRTYLATALTLMWMVDAQKPMTTHQSRDARPERMPAHG
jgi:ubiquinone/menaquinone biosynthesis C-methylase UbiE